MLLRSLDERDLLLPLYEGLREQPLWQTFLRRLMARTAAQTVCLTVQTKLSAGVPPLQRVISDRSGATAPDIEQLCASGLIACGALRPNRVYTLQEFLNCDDGDMRKRQLQELASQSIAHGRFIRITSGGDNAWLVLLHDRMDFGADDSALLSALAPHLCSALVTLVELDGLRLRAAIAEGTLDLLGVRQAPLDREGDRVGDGTFRPEQPGGGWPLAARASPLLTEACHALAGMPVTDRRLVRTSDAEGADMLLRPCLDAQTALPMSAVVVGISRADRHPDPASAARIAAVAYGLSALEAALTVRICRGRSIVEAGADLRLTSETARNYSKRIYAKTGARGQADLVRIVLSGLTPMA